MQLHAIHRFRHGDKRFAIDPETCFCFECDEISWDVLERYPQVPVNRIYHELEGKYDREELKEVVGELEWLRATKAILPVRKIEEEQAVYEAEQGLKQVSLVLDAGDAAFASTAAASDSPGTLADLGRDAMTLLLSRSEKQRELTLEICAEAGSDNLAFIPELSTTALKAAALAGKSLTFTLVLSNVQVSEPPPALAGHTLSIRLEWRSPESAPETPRAFAKRGPYTLAKLSKALSALEGAQGAIVLRPNHADFGDALKALDEAGFAMVAIDIDGAFLANPDLAPEAMFAAMEQSAQYYAQRLLEHHYFRADPIASLFWRIYNGTPLRRSDPAGANTLAVDAQGRIFPSRHFVGIDDFQVGSLAEGSIDTERLKPFEDVGSLTTTACVKCWARNLCGGGSAAVHLALSGSFRTPHEPWCDAQRQWIGATVSAFNLLTAAGINFARMYKVLDRTKPPSLFTMARAAFRMNIGMRPLEEADSKRLSQWESWNRSAYFLLNQGSVVIGSEYEREMDAVHPRPTELEVVLVLKDGTPFGLFKVRPGHGPGIAEGLIYFHNDEDYASGAIRKGFRTLLKEASGQQSIQRLLAPAATWETGLQAFLEATGFQHAGTSREALYTNGQYHDMAVYRLDTKDL